MSGPLGRTITGLLTRTVTNNGAFWVDSKKQESKKLLYTEAEWSLSTSCIKQPFQNFIVSLFGPISFPKDSTVGLNCGSPGVEL